MRSMFMMMLMPAHVASVCFVCMCATNIGTYVCSESSISTVAACMSSFCMYSGVIVETAMNNGM